MQRLSRSSMLVICFVVIALLFGCALFYISLPETEMSVGGTETQNLKQKSRTEEILNEMSLEEKVGQMLFFGTYDPVHLPKVASLIQEGKIGGFMLMKPHFTTPEETKKLVHALQEARTDIGPLIAVDQEGGIVTRMQFADSEVTAQSAIDSVSTAKAVATRRSIELSDLGIHINFAPVLDTARNPESFLYDRVFRGSDGEVEDLAVTTVRSYEENNIAATVKHFPGHPDNAVDSHEALPIVEIDEADFGEHVELFRDVIQSSQPSLVMMGHILFPEIDPVYPASLSPSIVHYLREDIGYDGLIITDGLLMQAVTDSFNEEDIALQSVHAGNDVLLYVAEPDIIDRVHRTLVNAVQAGDISEDEINIRVKRILALKERFLLLQKSN